MMSNSTYSKSEQQKLAHTIRDACISAAREGFRDASMSGLCREGAIEAAIGAMQSLDLEAIISKTKHPDAAGQADADQNRQFAENHNDN